MMLLPPSVQGAQVLPSNPLSPHPVTAGVTFYDILTAPRLAPPPAECALAFEATSMLGAPSVVDTGEAAPLIPHRTALTPQTHDESAALPLVYEYSVRHAAPLSAPTAQPTAAHGGEPKAPQHHRANPPSRSHSLYHAPPPPSTIKANATSAAPFTSISKPAPPAPPHPSQPPLPVTITQAETGLRVCVRAALDAPSAPNLREEIKAMFARRGYRAPALVLIGYTSRSDHG